MCKLLFSEIPKFKAHKSQQKPHKIRKSPVSHVHIQSLQCYDAMIILYDYDRTFSKLK